MDLIGSLPPFMAVYRELAAALDAEEPEFDLAWDGANRILDDQFVPTAGAEGLARYEALLGTPPSAGDGLPARRARILAALGRRMPYTFSWLRAWLDARFGPGGHAEVIENYTCTLRLDGVALTGAHLTAQELFRALIPAMPANIYWSITVTLPMRRTLSAASAGVTRIAVLPVPEQTDPPRRTSVLRVGGSYTILSN